MLTVDNLNYKLNKGRTILEEVSIAVNKGDFVTILGNNGAGKSTMLKCINRLLPYQSGKILIDDKDIKQLTRIQVAQNIAHVAQENSRVNCTVYDSIILGRKPYIGWDMGDRDREITNEVIRKMNMQDLAMKSLMELSGGELQKVVIARALVQEPRLLLLDEPTNNLDLKNQLEVLSLVKSICIEQGIGSIVILHDLSLAARFADKFIFLKDKTIKAFGGIEVLNAQTIEDVYGVPVAVEEIHGRMTVVPL